MSAIILLIIRILLAGVLYLFIGWVIYTIWMDFNQRDHTPVTPGIPPVTLKYADEQSEKVDFFTRPMIIIGREPTCDCVIHDRSVSARQAKLSYHHSQWWIEDLDSTNGTFLNRDKITQPTVIISGDQISSGATVIVVEIGTPA